MALSSEQIDAWKTALRSGEHKQAHGNWKRGEALCCLNVLIKINEKPIYNPYDLSADLTGLEWLNKAVPDQSPFINMNDHLRRTFEEIADRIDEVLA